MQTEVEDLRMVLDAIGGASALFGWSYGPLIVLRTAHGLSGTQIIAYEPVMKPLGEDALPALGGRKNQKAGAVVSRLPFGK